MEKRPIVRFDRILVVSIMLFFATPGCFDSRAVEEKRSNPDGDTLYNSQTGYESVGGGAGSVNPRDATDGRVVSREAGSVGFENSGGIPAIGRARGEEIRTDPVDVDDICPQIKYDMDTIPIDIIIAVETTDGMGDEVAQLNEYLNRSFVERLREAQIEPLVILIASQNGDRASGEHLCIDAPLGSGNCPYDSNPPHYFRIDRAVGENDALNQLADSSTYAPYLRQGARKIFIVVSDGDATAAPHESAFDFIQTVEQQPEMFTDWAFYGIYCFEQCAIADAVGQVYGELVAETNGVASDLCLQDFVLSFEELSNGVINRDPFPCRWLIPPFPDGDYPDPDYVNVICVDRQGRRTTIPRADGEAECESHAAWFYLSVEDPMQIGLCPAVCRDFQQGYCAELPLVLGCSLPMLE